MPVARSARRAAARGSYAEHRAGDGGAAASVRRPSAKRIAPYGTTALVLAASRLDRSQALSFTNRLAPRPLGCEPFSVVTVTGSERVSFPAASVTEAWIGVAPVGELRGVEREGRCRHCSGQGAMTMYGLTQRVLLVSSARLDDRPAVDDDPDARDAAARVTYREPQRIARR